MTQIQAEPRRHSPALRFPPQGDWPTFAPGLVWLVGAGPGDPGLLTLHGLNALVQANHVVYDALANPAVLDWCSPGATLEFAGKRGGRPSPEQRDITLRLIELAKSGAKVLRLKGGDPFTFGRGGEEALMLTRAGVPIRITPGVTAGIGGLAYAGIPVTHRDFNRSVTFVTGHDVSGDGANALDWSALSKGSQVIVLYMATKWFRAIAKKFLATGRDPGEPVAIVSRATTPDQVVVVSKLKRAADDMEKLRIQPPSIVCVGRNVLLRHEIEWVSHFDGSENECASATTVRS
ncbi:MAG: uroporphyrinogen-III C-methyltransferase [Albidovulum sp.]|nr:uroporphyrinogen-III C-methyltransferase [Albidovulum sp.]